jgi:transcription initiation factor TFIIIB Brf1 subunit/transcription initiation factor TFIIB
MNCKGICSRYEVSSINLKESGRYEKGHKRCTSCYVFMDYEGTKCPCCGNKLRTKPKNSSGRNKASTKLIFANLQKQLTLSEGTINYSEKLFRKIKNKLPFKFQSEIVVIATCIFIAAKLKHEPKAIKEISSASEVKKDLLELTCTMALDDLKQTLVAAE